MSIMFRRRDMRFFISASAFRAWSLAARILDGSFDWFASSNVFIVWSIEFAVSRQCFRHSFIISSIVSICWPGRFCSPGSAPY
jgi:hypothetical protein